MSHPDPPRGHVEVDKEEAVLYRVSESGRDEVELGPLRETALRLLYYLYDRGCEHPGQAVTCSREELVEAVWAGKDLTDPFQALRQLVQRIRRVIEPSSGLYFLVTREGEGYCLYSAPLTASSPQPFTLNPVRLPARFFGRYDLLRDIFELWRGSSPLNFLVQGLPRSGKTSLFLFLHQIARTPPYLLRPRQRADDLAPVLDARYVYVDLHLPPDDRPGVVQSEILAGLGLDSRGVETLGGFRDRIVDEFDGKAIILFDEMHRAFDDPSMEDLWTTLRWLAGRPAARKASFAFAFTWDSNVPLEGLRRRDVSPFFNIFPSSFELGPFSESEALELIESSPVAVQIPDQRWILEESRGWPALLQVLCSERLRAHRREEESEDWKRRAVARCSELQAVLKV